MTANVRPTREGALDDTALIKTADVLARHARERRSLTLSDTMCGRLADVILEVVNRGGAA